MELTIWKFPLEVKETQYIYLPDGAEILSVQAQLNVPCLWAIVNPKNKKCERRIEMRGTGNPLSQVGQFRFIGTFQITQGMNLVFHVFDAKV